MADLQSMTLTERMNDINSDGLQDYTFQILQKKNHNKAKLLQLEKEKKTTT